MALGVPFDSFSLHASALIHGPHINLVFCRAFARVADPALKKGIANHSTWPRGYGDEL